MIEASCAATPKAEHVALAHELLFERIMQLARTDDKFANMILECDRMAGEMLEASQ